MRPGAAGTPSPPRRVPHASNWINPAKRTASYHQHRRVPGCCCSSAQVVGTRGHRHRQLISRDSEHSRQFVPNGRVKAGVPQNGQRHGGQTARAGDPKATKTRARRAASNQHESANLWQVEGYHPPSFEGAPCRFWPGTPPAGREYGGFGDRNSRCSASGRTRSNCAVRADGNRTEGPRSSCARRRLGMARPSGRRRAGQRYG